MTSSGTKYQVTALAAAVFGLLCLPCLVAPLLIAAGLSSVLLLVGTWFVPLLIGLIGVSVIGFLLSYRRHKNPLPVVLAVASGALMYDSRYVAFNQSLTYVGVAVLLAAIGLDWWIRQRTTDCGDCTLDRTTESKGKGIVA